MKSEVEDYGTRMRLDTFDPQKGLDRGKSRFVEILWYLFKMAFILSAFPWPQKVKHGVLKMFGAKIGTGVVVKPRVNIHFPWKLILEDHCWVGEECFILNFEEIIVGAHACLSQRSFLCGGNHNFRTLDFEYRNGPITVKPGAWVGAQSFVGPGVTIGTDTVVAAGSIVTKSLPDNTVCSGNPCVVQSARWKD
ncbi:MAG: WcaF family extracellular polysaccharide biosynthesis acetyltransferase [Verrucomicrobiae bacterium]|nr:WcaF family extracellular polysaccharide biosynthesis acetyltransferase [Verrucomicrobiae bacterium]